MNPLSVPPFAQPFITLFERNTELFNAVNAQAGAAEETGSQAQPWAVPTSLPGLSAASLPVALRRGLIKNHTEFMTDMARCWTEVLAQGQAALVGERDSRG